MFNKITIEISTSKTPQQAWTVYTDPEYIVKWNFASKDWHCPSAENDLKVGGNLNYRMESVDGKYGFDFTAKFTTVNPYKEISYQLDDSRIVKVEFIENNNQLLVRETFDAEKENSEELQKNGWQAILDNFKQVLERV